MADPTTALISRTQRRLFAMTLGLVALLVVLIGAASAWVALRALDADVDRALTTRVEAAVGSLHDGVPGVVSPTAAPDDEGGSDDDDEDDEDDDESDLAASDTFLLILGPDGTIVANPSAVRLPGLPDPSAVAAAADDGRDLRTVDAGGTQVRVLTVAVFGEDGDDAGDGPATGFVQGGFVLTLHDEQSRSIVVAVLLVGAIGLIGAAVVTLVVTGRALVPIRRSFEAQRRFVADASHELRTPAALIRANAEVVEREGLVTADGRPLVADIVTEADRLGRLVGDLLQLAGSDATGVTIDPRPVDLATLASDTVRQADALATGRGARLAMSQATVKQAVVDGDRDRLVQLLLILLDNAFDHSPAGGTVTVDVQRVGEVVELTVADQGPGIPPAERERVFEPFTRLPGVRRDRAGGTGLGLAIARRIASAHRGTIHAADASGGGAAFVVTIPASRGAPAG